MRQEIELLDGQSGSPESLPRNSNNSISDAKLLKNIEKSYDKRKKLLDESSSVLEDSDVRFRGEDGKVLFGMNAEEYYNTVILYERNERYKNIPQDNERRAETNAGNS